MTTQLETQLEGVDFALAAYREEGVWQLHEIAHELLADLESLLHALRRFPGDGGALGLIGVDEDFFLVLRVAGSRERLLLSDVTAADEWELAQAAVERLGLPLPEEDDEPAPAGDLDIVGDWGLSAMDMGILIDDEELYPDEILSEVADKLGFGALFDDAVGIPPA